MANIINKSLRKLGYEIKHYPNMDLNRRMKLLKEHGVDLILDIGASVGEYGKIMRRNGYKGRIVSFEPIKKSFSKLQINANNDSLWDVNNFALGNENKESKINISKNYDSSSILDINDIHLSATSRVSIIGTEEITVKTLDSVFEKIYKNEKSIYIKMDTQGYERFVLEGAKSVLPKIIGIQLELSITPLYDNSDDYNAMISYLNEFGFKLFSVEPGFYNKKTGRLLQFDGIFYKEK